MKSIAKSVLHGVFLLLALPLALLSAFGRIGPLFAFGAQSVALVPGLPGDYLRVAFYCLTLKECHAESRIQFGSFFSNPNATVARGVYIGSYCILGKVHLGERTQVASGVQVLSGRKQHPRDAEGAILGSATGTFSSVNIGANCWIGAQAIVMADVGSGSTIGAGAVVVKPIPNGVVAVGNPARVLAKTDSDTSRDR